VQALIGDGVAGEQPLEVPGRGDEDEHAAGDERDDCDVDLVLGELRRGGCRGSAGDEQQQACDVEAEQ
jgi:hypothetical protein